ncbi:hypothetical protein K2Y11_18060, partial [bacterium]|nr:hypothetical protein [bacterium]
MQRNRTLIVAALVMATLGAVNVAQAQRGEGRGGPRGNGGQGGPRGNWQGGRPGGNPGGQDRQPGGNPGGNWQDRRPGGNPGREWQGGRPAGTPNERFNRGDEQRRFYPPNNPGGPGANRQTWMQDRRNYWQNNMSNLRNNPAQVHQNWMQQRNQWRNNFNNPGYRNQFYGNRNSWGNNWGFGGSPFGSFGYFGGRNNPFGYYGLGSPYLGAQNYYGNWYQGRWGGPLFGNNWNGYWNRRFNAYPLATALGLSSWALNGGMYSFGLGNYNNPFYTSGGGLGYVNYNQPFVADTTSYSSSYAASDDTGATSDNPSMVAFGEARSDFRNGDYNGALQRVNKALETSPRDPILNEFRSLVLFAQGDYRQSAEALHPVLALGPGWDWATMAGLYGNVNTYTDHLRALEKYRNNNPDAPEARFLLGYHYMTTGHRDAASREFERYNTLVKDDSVGKNLYQLVSSQGDENEKNPQLEEAIRSAEKSVTPTANVDHKRLIGTWKAEGKDSKSYTVELKEDGEFQWTFNGNDQTKTLEGAYVVDKDTLILEPKSGGALLAKIDVK